MPDPSIGDPRFLIRRANYDSVLTNPSVRARERNRSPAEPAIRIEAEFLKAEAFKARRLDKASSQATGSRARKLCLGGSRTPFAIHPSIALQPFERSAFGEFRVRHRHLSSIYCPVSASLGLEVRVSDCCDRSLGGFDPLRGPKAAVSALPKSYYIVQPTKST